jgi:hypothetical protein
MKPTRKHPTGIQSLPTDPPRRRPRVMEVLRSLLTRRGAGFISITPKRDLRRFLCGKAAW